MLTNKISLYNVLIATLLFSCFVTAYDEQSPQKICNEIVTLDSEELTQEQHIAVLKTLTEQVKQGKCVDEALTTLYSLLYSQDPLIQEYIDELNHAIAQWCISTIDEIFN